MPSESEKGGDQYAVVKFPEEGNPVALVHTKWLHGDVCLWPQDSKNVSYLAKCGASPSSNWQVVPCVPIDTFRTYDAERQKLKQAEDRSDLGSEVDLGRGKIKKQRRALSSSPGSVQRLPLPPPSMVKSIKQVIRLLQTVILRVENLGSQLDIIKAKLCDQQLQLEADLLEKPFCDITEFELFDQGLSESAAMKSKLSCWSDNAGLTEVQHD
ncbi:uncharacterized protein [Dermacentor andersoni]|uniref:uncharacterized protein n=1 Tax=Dermacentor andersoni TaxID=34620 RepID=UPI003B3A8EFE